MFKLLRADLYRALRYKVFWVLLAGNALLGFIAVLNAYSFYVNFGPQYNAFYAMQQGLGGGCGLLGILSAIIISVFIGHEYAAGGMRNKIMTGGGRVRVYLSKLVLSCGMCVLVYLSFHAMNFVFGSALLGWEGVPAGQILLTLLAGLMFTLAYACIFTAVGMLSKSTVAGLLIGILGTLVMAFAVMYLQGELGGYYGHDPADPEGAVFYPCEWPMWLQNLARGFIALIPTGTSLPFAEPVIGNLGTYCARSCLWIALSAVGGSALFCRVDLK